jgi:DNA polymerase III delta prime subunit
MLASLIVATWLMINSAASRNSVKAGIVTQRRHKALLDDSEGPVREQPPLDSPPPPKDGPRPGMESQPPARWTPRSAVVKSGPSWNEVILPEVTKYALLAMQLILHDPDAFRRQFHEEPPRGIILYGPPGTGKTLIARALTTSVGADPGGAGRAHNSLPNQLLRELDGFNQSAEMVFTIAATNRLDNLDPAFKSRFPSQIEIGLPDDAARLALLKLYTQGYQDRLIYPLGRLVIRSKGLGGRDISNLCRQAALYTFGTKRLLVGYFAFAYAFEQLGRPLASAVIQQAVAESWPKEQLGEAELLARAKAHFGAVLTEQFKAGGQTLEEKVMSVADRLNAGQVGALRLIAGLQTLDSPAAFIEDCRELEEELYLALNEPSEKN